MEILKSGDVEGKNEDGRMRRKAEENQMREKCGYTRLVFVFLSPGRPFAYRMPTSRAF